MTPRDLISEYEAFLRDFLPKDYYPNWPVRRHDRGLRQDYQRAAFDHGWLMPSWPAHLGGRDLNPLDEVAVRLTAARLRAPKLDNVQTVGVVAPALRELGTTEQIAEHLVPSLRGTRNWALGMSEPEAGSDLASLRTRGERVGDTFRITGQKTWTTQAHTSEWIMVYCRTDQDAPRHRGISCLLVPLDLPGITVRQIVVGWPDADEFCEVFFDAVEVPSSHLLGPLHDGWSVARAALTHERSMIWINNFADAERSVAAAAQALQDRHNSDAVEELGRIGTRVAALQAVGMGVLEAMSVGAPGNDDLLLKLIGSELVQDAAEFALAAGGLSGLGDSSGLFDEFESLGATIYGGTSEIQRNIIGERVLGLPRQADPRGNRPSS